MLILNTKIVKSAVWRVYLWTLDYFWIIKQNKGIFTYMRSPSGWFLVAVYYLLNDFFYQKKPLDVFTPTSDSVITREIML